MELRTAQTLLGACLTADTLKGGTIWDYLPRLAWRYAGYSRSQQTPIWHLQLDGRTLGAFLGSKVNLPPICPWLDMRFIMNCHEAA